MSDAADHIERDVTAQDERPETQVPADEDPDVPGIPDDDADFEDEEKIEGRATQVARPSGSARPVDRASVHAHSYE